MAFRSTSSEVFFLCLILRKEFRDGACERPSVGSV